MVVEIFVTPGHSAYTRWRKQGQLIVYDIADHRGDQGSPCIDSFEQPPAHRSACRSNNRPHHPLVIIPRRKIGPSIRRRFYRWKVEADLGYISVMGKVQFKFTANQTEFLLNYSSFALFYL